jgi:hypothetical protein
MYRPLTFLFFAIISLASLLSLLAVFKALFTERVNKIEQALNDGLARNFWLGLVNTLVFIGLAAILTSASESTVFTLISVLAVAILGIYLVGLTLGLSALSQYLGGRLLPAREGLAAQWRGGLALALAALTPYVGWFLLLPYALCLAFGAFVSVTVQTWRER